MASTIEEFWFPVNIPLDETVNFNTLITKYEDGKEQRRSKWSQPKRSYDVSFRGRSDVSMQQIWDFYVSRSGMFDTFYFENPNETPIANENIGSGDSIKVSFNTRHFPLPSGSVTITSGVTTFSETTHFTLTRSTGAIVFNTAPTGDLTIPSYNFCRVVRFGEDNMDRELFNYKLYNASVKLIEVL